MSTLLDSVDAVTAWITEPFGNQELKCEYPFVIVMKDSNRIVGSTRYKVVKYNHRTVEVAYTRYPSDLWAKFEDRLRNHRIRRNGTYRDTMMYSITDSEWNTVKNLLNNRIVQFNQR